MARGKTSEKNIKEKKKILNRNSNLDSDVELPPPYKRILK